MRDSESRSTDALPACFLYHDGKEARFTDEAALRTGLAAAFGELEHVFNKQEQWIYKAAPQVIAESAGLLSNPESEFHGRSIAAGERIGMHAEMVREALRNFFSMFDSNALQDLRAHQLAGRKALPPRIVFHVLAGNLFISGIESMIMASLCGSCSLVRCSADDPEFARIWIEATAAVDPQFAKTMAAGWWPREYERATGDCSTNVDAVVAFGDDGSIEEIRRLVPVHKRFIGHGSKISFAILTREALAGSDAEQYAALLAYDFSVYDQQGCLSPRAAFLETRDDHEAETFAQILSTEMEKIARNLPRRKLRLEEAATVARSRDQALIEAAMGKPACVFHRTGQPFLVTLRPISDYSPGCMDRFCDLRTLSSTDELHGVLSRFRGKIATIGIAGNASRFVTLMRQLRVPRICPVGSMQKPQMGWTHDGRLPLIDLMDFADFEVEMD